MGFKKFFGGGGGSDKLPEQLDIDDLIVLERYTEAEDKLRAKLQATPNDLHSHVKLAEVYTALRKVDSALQEFLYAAEEFADDGFYDKAIALLAKAAKLAPADPTISQRLERFEELKRVEHARTMAIEGLMAPRASTTEKLSVLAAQQVWFDVQGTRLVKKLTADQLKRLFAAVTIVNPAKGEIVAARGSKEAALFMVLRGDVEAVFETAGNRTVLRAFGAGDIFGEGSLFEHQPWPATYFAGGGCSLFKLDKAGLEQTLVGNTDPVGLLETLRGARADREVAQAMEKLRTWS